jgi:hypothetical protein
MGMAVDSPIPPEVLTSIISGAELRDARLIVLDE